MKLMPTSANEIRDQWDASAASFDEFSTPVTMASGERLLRYADVRPGVRLLDVAVDLSPAMIERLSARAGAAGLATIDARVMDATALELADDSFDISVSMNGASTLPDVAAGLAEMARVTRPGGSVLVAAAGAPQRVEFVGYFTAALQAAVPGFEPLPTDPPPPPFQLADPAALRSRLEDAGLHDVQVETVTWGMYFASASHYWNFVNGNPIGAAIAAELTDEQRTATRRVVEGMLHERSGGGAVVLDADMNIGTGTA